MNGLRILVVEDEALVAEDIGDNLSRLGYQYIDIAATGEAAIELAGRNRPDVVLMDIRLRGEIDGIGAAQAIHDRYRTPVVYLTAYSDQPTMDRAKLTEPFGYLLKPYNPQELRSTIEVAAFKSQMEERLRASARWYASTLRDMNDGLVTTDLDGHVTFMNPAAEGILGQSAMGALGKPLEVVMQFPGENGGVPIETPVQTVLRLGGPVETPPHTMFHAERRANLVLSENAAPLRDESGRITGVVIVFRDLTLHNRLEQALRQEQKIDALGRFAAGIAHDFNNLLTGVIGYANMILDKSTDPVSRHQASEIKRAGERSAALTRQLLTFGRKEAAQTELCDLRQLVRGVRELLGRGVGPNYGIEISSSSEPAMILADPGHVEQILLNLAMNAADAMPGGGQIAIEVAEALLTAPVVSFYSQISPGEYVVLAIRDTGRGIDSSTLPNIFEPFFTTKEAGYGIGLGLATVFGLLRQNQGQIRVETKPGAGTTFWIYFPRQKTRGSSGHAPVLPAPQRPTETILVVEDQPYLLSLVVQILRDAGYAVLAAAGPEEALALAKQHTGEIHVLLSDVAMPGESGPSLAKRMVALHPKLKVMFMSGYGEGVLDTGNLMARFAFIQKPFDAAELAEQLQRFLHPGS